MANIIFHGGLAGIRYNRLDKVLKEKYSSGTSWYRIYSDGWIEQGGVLGANTADLTYLKSFKNTNYSIFTTYFGGSGRNGTGYPSEKTKNGATIVKASIPISWFACGY